MTKILSIDEKILERLTNKLEEEYIQKCKDIAWKKRLNNKRKRYIYETKFDIKRLLSFLFFIL